MNKRVIAKCHHCGGAIYVNERHQIVTDDTGSYRYHFDHGVDCLAAEKHAIEVMHQMELALEGD